MKVVCVFVGPINGLQTISCESRLLSSAINKTTTLERKKMSVEHGCAGDHVFNSTQYREIISGFFGVFRLMPLACMHNVRILADLVGDGLYGVELVGARKRER